MTQVCTYFSGSQHGTIELAEAQIAKNFYAA
nr:MAG TPA: hypothetical protein [Caudoviricetes sp.]DAZ59311.1 MAG TPA: hypothetical protein [Caudoviricetes sp.]